MATLTLKKKAAAIGKTFGRAPIRGRGIANPRPTIAQAQKERQEREERYQAQRRDAPQREPREFGRDAGAPPRPRPAGADAPDRRDGPPPRRDEARGPHRNERHEDPRGQDRPHAKPSSRFVHEDRNRPTEPQRDLRPGPRGYGPDPGRPREDRHPERSQERNQDNRGGFGAPRHEGPRAHNPHQGLAPAAKPQRNTGTSAGGIVRGSRGQDRGPARPDRPAREQRINEPGRPRQMPRAHQGAPLTPNEEGDRLSKRMGELGLASRREADDWIAAGWVKVDGRLAVLGQRVGRNVKIDIDPAARTQQAQQVTILLHKPIGYVSGQAEDGYEPASVLVQPQNRWDDDSSQVKYHEGHRRSLAPAGRLDIDSTGLLVLTQDGRTAKLLIGEDSTIEKEYLVRVEAVDPQGGELLSAEGLALLNHGLELDGEKLKPAKVSWINDDQLRFVLREGKKRQIRRMCELVGLKVVGLKRVRIGRINLGHLPVGQWRYLGPWERFD